MYSMSWPGCAMCPRASWGLPGGHKNAKPQCYTDHRTPGGASTLASNYQITALYTQSEERLIVRVNTSTPQVRILCN